MKLVESGGRVQREFTDPRHPEPASFMLRLGRGASCRLSPTVAAAHEQFTAWIGAPHETSALRRVVRVLSSLPVPPSTRSRSRSPHTPPSLYHFLTPLSHASPSLFSPCTLPPSSSQVRSGKGGRSCSKGAEALRDENVGGRDVLRRCKT